MAVRVVGVLWEGDAVSSALHGAKVCVWREGRDSDADIHIDVMDPENPSQYPTNVVLGLDGFAISALRFREGDEEGASPLAALQEMDPEEMGVVHQRRG